MTPESFSSEFDRLYRARRAAVKGRGIDTGEYRDTLTVEEQEVVTAIENKGLDMIGVGAGRVVFEHPQDDNMVLKVARYGENPTDDGFIQNRIESETSEKANEDTRLQPVESVAHNNQWLTMKKVEMLPNTLEDESKRQQIVDSLQNHLLNSEVFVKLLDVREENIGVTENGEIVLVDYGLGN